MELAGEVEPNDEEFESASDYEEELDATVEELFQISPDNLYVLLSSLPTVFQSGEAFTQMLNTANCPDGLIERLRESLSSFVSSF